jgi:predicted glutamine amidotransferase
MCRLFFSFHHKNAQSLLREFLAQSVHRTKNTPGLQNHRDHTNHIDGFGIAWKAKLSQDWTIYKQPLVYTKDKNLPDVIESIPNNNKVVIAHIRKRTQGKVSLENTHPFYYKGHIFAQNGSIKDFEKHRALLMSYVCAEFIREIRGETDTECLFFLFLSCIHFLRNTMKKKSTTSLRGCTETQFAFYKSIMEQMAVPQQSQNKKYSVYFTAFSMMAHIFKKHKIELVANIIYGNDQIVLLSRYIGYETTTYKEKQIPPSLYWNKCSTNNNAGILITSEPLSNHESVLIPENVVAIIDYKKNELVVDKIL